MRVIESEMWAGQSSLSSIKETKGIIKIMFKKILIAAGEPLPYTQDDINVRLRAVECRITAEDASRNFLPCPGGY